MNWLYFDFVLLIRHKKDFTIDVVQVSLDVIRLYWEKIEWEWTSIYLWNVKWNAVEISIGGHRNLLLENDVLWYFNEAYLMVAEPVKM